MKKDVIPPPMLPFTEDEEAALAGRLTAMDSAALTHYVESAKQSLGNRALAPSWRGRIEFGLGRAEAALLTAIALEAAAAAMPPEPAAPEPAAKPKTSKAKKAAEEAKKVEEA